MDKFVLNTWISETVSYFVGILCEVGDIFLLSYPQLLSLLNAWSRSILNHIKAQSKEGNPFIVSIDVCMWGGGCLD